MRHSTPSNRLLIRKNNKIKSNVSKVSNLFALYRNNFHLNNRTFIITNISDWPLQV